MLEYSLELEQKIAVAGLAAGNVIPVLALCGDGFRWHQESARSFLAFYSTGAYRGDDSFCTGRAQVHGGQKHFAQAKHFALCVFPAQAGRNPAKPGDLALSAAA